MDALQTSSNKTSEVMSLGECFLSGHSPIALPASGPRNCMGYHRENIARERTAVLVRGSYITPGFMRSNSDYVVSYKRKLPSQASS